MTTWKIGNTVKLKSGGPKMTVRTVADDEIITDWFEGMKPMFGRFHPDQLMAGISPSRELSRKINDEVAEGIRRNMGV
jgi:uncharacterized protein YodC (DUF2158 family)